MFGRVWLIEAQEEDLFRYMGEPCTLCLAGLSTTVGNTDYCRKSGRSLVEPGKEAKKNFLAAQLQPRDPNGLWLLPLVK